MVLDLMKSLILITMHLSSEESGTSKGHTHVGLRNLNRRLILMYGPECALHIESTSMVKTAISFKIPCEK